MPKSTWLSSDSDDIKAEARCPASKLNTSSTIMLTLKDTSSYGAVVKISPSGTYQSRKPVRKYAGSGKVMNAPDFLKMLPSETSEGRTGPLVLCLWETFSHGMWSVPKCVKFLVHCILCNRRPKYDNPTCSRLS